MTLKINNITAARIIFSLKMIETDFKQSCSWCISRDMTADSVQFTVCSTTIAIAFHLSMLFILLSTFCFRDKTGCLSAGIEFMYGVFVPWKVSYPTLLCSIWSFLSNSVTLWWTLTLKYVIQWFKPFSVFCFSEFFMSSFIG